MFKRNSFHKFGMSANGSKLEKALGDYLNGLVMAGDLSDLKEQVRVRVCCRSPDCRHDEKIEYIADFSAIETKSGERIYIEAKGFDEPKWRLKRRLWKHTGPGRLQVWKGSYKKFYLDEEITPRPL